MRAGESMREFCVSTTPQ